MGYKIELNSYAELLSFISFTTELGLWETRRFSLLSAANVAMNIDTTTPSGYTQFASLNSYIDQYYVNNGSLAITVDVKLVCPDGYRQSIDPDGHYAAFFLNLYSSGTVTYLNLTYDEDCADLVNDPFVAWVAYVKILHNKWLTFYND